MIRILSGNPPSAEVMKQLKRIQDEIDACPDFAARSEMAKRKWANKPVGVFAEIRERLREICPGIGRCVYCENNDADEVDHIAPKDIYPERCFDWENFLFVCGGCNRTKSNKYAVFRNSDNQFEELTPAIGRSVVQPKEGVPVFINPRVEDPMILARLDINTSYLFKPVPGSDEQVKERVDFTYNYTLGMDSTKREYLRTSLRLSYYSYFNWLHRIVTERTKGISETHINSMIDNLKKENHPTVWKEIQRYRKNGWLRNIDIQFDQLFDQSPEAINW